MSVKISFLKKSKGLVNDFIKQNYQDLNFCLFYSIGEQSNDFMDQFLKVECSLSEEKKEDLRIKILDFLTKKDIHYSELRVRMSNFRTK